MPVCPACGEGVPYGQFCPKDGMRLVDTPSEGAGGTVVDGLVGRVLANRFRILRKIGQGGMGAVYEAEHCFIRKRVALKLLRAEITEKPEAVARFQREALAASTIGHDNIVTIDDFGELADGQVYLTMELLQGEPLSVLLGRGALSRERMVNILAQTCRGLAAAHEKGIVHRDMKPENIFVVDRVDEHGAGDLGDKVKILDFGIAKVARSDGAEQLTKTGAIFGTPNYMAPEQALGRNVDARADVYSLGVIIYEMLAGRVPFHGDSFLAVLTQHVTEEAPFPSEVAESGRRVDKELEAVAMRAIAKDPADRFQTVLELLRELTGEDHGLAHAAPGSSALGLGRRTGPGASVDRAQRAVSPRADGQDTLAQASGESVDAGNHRPRRRSRVLWLAIGAALLSALGALAIARQWDFGDPWRGNAEGTTSRPASAGAFGGERAREATGSKAVPPAFRGVRDRAATVANVVVPRDAGMIADGAVAPVMVIITSQPSGAQIWNGAVSVGRTPESLMLAAGETQLLELRLAGYRPRRIAIEVAPGTRKHVEKVTLLPARAASRHGTGKAATTTPVLRTVDPASDSGALGDHGDSGDHGDPAGAGGRGAEKSGAAQPPSTERSNEHGN